MASCKTILLHYTLMKVSRFSCSLRKTKLINSNFLISRAKTRLNMQNHAESHSPITQLIQKPNNSHKNLSDKKELSNSLLSNQLICKFSAVVLILVMSNILETAGSTPGQCALAFSRFSKNQTLTSIQSWN